MLIVADVKVGKFLNGYESPWIERWWAVQNVLEITTGRERRAFKAAPL